MDFANTLWRVVTWPVCAAMGGVLRLLNLPRRQTSFYRVLTAPIRLFAVGMLWVFAAPAHLLVLVMVLLAVAQLPRLAS